MPAYESYLTTQETLRILPRDCRPVPKSDNTLDLQNQSDQYIAPKQVARRPETNLEESLQPPNLEHTLSDKHGKLEDAPPLHPRVGALRRVPVYPLSHHNVRLLILNLGQGLGKSANCFRWRESVSESTDLTADRYIDR